jgi:hypothetical protein
MKPTAFHRAMPKTQSSALLPAHISGERVVPLRRTSARGTRAGGDHAVSARGSHLCPGAYVRLLRTRDPPLGH